MQYIEEFRKVFPFYNNMTETDKEMLKNELRLIKLNAGEMMIKSGNLCTGIGFILSGTVRLYRLNEEGREITLYHINRGETCVLSAACYLGRGELDYPVLAIAETDAVVANINYEVFGKLFSQSKAMQTFFFNSFAERLFNLMEVVDVVAFKSISERLSDYLIKGTKNGMHPLYITHAQLAANIGTAREVVSRTLKSFEKRGLIKLARGKIEVLDSGHLQSL